VEFDLLLLGGSVVDGSGTPGTRADVGVRGGRIVAVGGLQTTRATQTLEVEGLTVAPGFVDVHTHSDMASFLPAASQDVVCASVLQGVTTEICGNCGLSAFPAGKSPSVVDGHVKSILGSEARFFSSLSSFHETISQMPRFNNLASLVGHGTIRSDVMGFQRRLPTASELEEMADEVDSALKQGAVGLSSGLVYAPGVYSETDELVRLCRAPAELGRLYTTHLRDEADAVEMALEEAIAIGRSAGVRVHVSHLKVAGPRNWGRSAALLTKIEEVRDSGMDIAFDVYPYTSGSTSLYSLLPPWVGEGGIETMVDRLQSGVTQEEIDRGLRDGIPGWQNLVGQVGWHSVTIASAPRHPQFEGKTILELSDEQSSTPVEFVCELLVAEGGHVTIIIELMHEADVSEILTSPLAMIGSDGIPLPGRPHPRWSGSFARVLGRFVREKGLLTIPQAIRKMSSLPASRFELTDRGEIAVGKLADMVVFDADTVIDQATYEDPLAPPIGVIHVIVKGTLVVRDGRMTGNRPGAFLLAS
jgi:N-acyl-D-amino-acid deacylase